MNLLIDHPDEYGHYCNTCQIYWSHPNCEFTSNPVASSYDCPSCSPQGYVDTYIWWRRDSFESWVMDERKRAGIV